MNTNIISSEFFSNLKDINLGFSHWRKKDIFPIGLAENKPKTLNYFSVSDREYKKYINPDFFFSKSKYNSYQIQLPKTELNELKLTNIKITDWDDVWQDYSGNILDPKIKILNLSHNLIKNISILDPRDHLEELNLSFNSPLVYFNVSNSKNLKKLDLSYCTSIEYINISSSSNIEFISIKNCNCSEDCLESLLRNITPHRVGKLDITGNKINWNNRNISSKIRLLLANNWEIFWDFDPPDSIIPLGYWKRFDPLLLDRKFKL